MQALNITYKTQLESVHRIFRDHNIICRKMTHAFRVLGAVNLDEAGLEERVSPWPALQFMPRS